MVMTRASPDAPIAYDGQIVANDAGLVNLYNENTFTDTIGNGTVDSTPLPPVPACQVNDQIFTGIFSRRHTPNADNGTGKVEMKVIDNVISPNL